MPSKRSRPGTSVMRDHASRMRRAGGRWARWIAIAALVGACTGPKTEVGGSGEGKAPIEQQNENELPFERAPLPTTPSSSLPPETLQLDLSESEVVAPFSLTASDGTGLRVVALKARGVVDEPLAFTELHMTFENPEDRTIEGRFQIDMPPGAAISRFAMKIGDRWQEGEVVERKAAQQAYEDFLHRRQDPALLENKAGNQFSARVFPIPPRARKELIISFSQELPSSSEPYRLLLRGLPQLDELDARVIIRERAGETGPTTSLGGSATNQQVIEIKKQAFTPDRDLEVRSKREHQALGLRHENLSVARIAPVADLPADPIDGLTILFDTSASRALGYGRQVHSGTFPLASDVLPAGTTGTFIRAPRITQVGAGCEVLARRDGDPVLVRRGPILAACFHPELSPGHPVTALFAQAIAGRQAAAAECGA